MADMFQQTTLNNGLRVVTQHLGNTQAVTVLILVGAGSRYEKPEINGLSHFLEHMFFKGAEKYKNTKEVSEAIDSVGGDFNAFTGKEYVGYYVKVAATNVGIALDVLSDMLLKSKFDPAEIDRERGVIMEEYNMYQDTPMHQIGWDFERLIYGNQPMGWDQVGTKEVINGVQRADFVDYQQKLYSADNTVISIAGNVKHEDMIRELEKLFIFDARKKAFQAAKLEDNKDKNTLYIRNKKTEQAHVMLGVPGYSELHPLHYPAKMLGIVLGGNMSSRMFLSVRERQGLAYYISTSTDDYTDSGTFSTNAGVSLNGIDKAITAILDEYRTVRDEKVPETELKKAKDYLKGKLVLRLEDSEEYAHLLGKYEILYNKVKPIEEIIKEIDSVTTEQMSQVAQEIFATDKLYLAVIGPYEDRERFAKLLKL